MQATQNKWIAKTCDPVLLVGDKYRIAVQARGSLKALYQ